MHANGRRAAGAADGAKRPAAESKDGWSVCPAQVVGRRTQLHQRNGFVSEDR